MPSRPVKLPHGRTLLRVALLGLALPCVYFGGASAAFFYRQRTDGAAGNADRLPPSPAPTSVDRTLVFAPHCDDETLGCAGLIQRTLAIGGQVQVVLLTNGDGFRAAVEAQVRDLRVHPDDYIRFAALRQQESYSALENLGLPHANVRFLGYPDGGLWPLWDAYWSPNHPYTSLYTRCDRSPYAITFDPRSHYCGADLLADIKATLRAFHPTLVTVTHPSDDHPDHVAAAAFVTRALQEMQEDPRERSWTRRTRLQYYLIHRGDWPLPQGGSADASLLPPAAMTHTDTHWTSLALSAEQTTRKARSIQRYPSQTAMMGGFLSAFARHTELFGEISPTRLASVPAHTIRLDGCAADWETLPPALLDPVRDNVLRDLQGGGDIRAFYACRDPRTLYLRLDLRQQVSARITYTLRLRPFGPHGETGPRAISLPLRLADVGQTRADGLRIAANGRILEVAVPWTALTQNVLTRNVLTQNVLTRNLLTRNLPDGDIRTLAVSAETRLAGAEVDRTGVRFLKVDPLSGQ